MGGPFDVERIACAYCDAPAQVGAVATAGARRWKVCTSCGSLMQWSVDEPGTVGEPVATTAFYQELRAAVAATMERLDQLARRWDELSDADRRALAAAAAGTARSAVDELLPVLVELVSSRRRRL